MQGKWPSSYGSVIVLSLRMMREMLKDELNNVLFFSELDFITLEEIDPFQAIDDLAMQYLVLSDKHSSIYTGGSMTQYNEGVNLSNREFNHYANDIVSSLPQSYDYTTSYLLYTSLEVILYK